MILHKPALKSRNSLKMYLTRNSDMQISDSIYNQIEINIYRYGSCKIVQKVETKLGLTYFSYQMNYLTTPNVFLYVCKWQFTSVC